MRWRGVSVNGLLRNGFFPLLMVFTFSLSAFSQQFSAPRTNRVKITIDTSWKFYLGDVTTARLRSYSDASWSTVHLPHTFGYITWNLSGSYTRGYGWYRKHFKLPAAYAGRRVTLYFEGAMTTAEVFVNDSVLATHYGGFNPFCYEISKYCTFDGSTDNLIAVRLNNTWQGEVPPEAPNNGGPGNIDFELEGGIYRDVYLIVSDSLYIPEPVHDWANYHIQKGGQFIWYPSVSTSSASIQIETWVRNSSASAKTCQLAFSLVDSTNTVVQTASTSGSIAAGSISKLTQTMTVSNPSLWYPWSPKRYTMWTLVYDGTKLVDVYKVKIGVRRITWSVTAGAYCNGTWLKFLGLNRHQTWPFVAHAVPNIQQRRDAERLKDAGCNLVRTSHYLQDDEFLDACDSLGICLWSEIAGWHCCYAPETSDTLWVSRNKQNIISNIRVCRNHPSVALYGVGINEATLDATLDAGFEATADAEDTTRSTTTARNYTTATNTYDLYSHNCFQVASMPTANPAAATTIGYLNTEHTGHTYATYRSDAEANLVTVSMKHDSMTAWGRSKAWCAGTMGWCAYDYNATYGAPTNYIRAHGAWDLFRIPKFTYYFYKSQCAGDNYDGSKHPMVFIQNFYTSTSPTNRRVVTNCDTVKLYRNSTLVGTMASIKNQAGQYCHHPACVFTGIAFATGELRADGIIGSSVVASHTVRTPGTAAAIVVTADPMSIQANGADFSRIIGTVVDAAGTPLPYATNTITFSTSLGTLIGANPAAAVAGAGCVLGKAGLTTGTMMVIASATTLTPDTVVITVRPMDPVDDPIVGVQCPAPAAFSAASAPAQIRPVLGSLLRLPGIWTGTRHVTVYDLKGSIVYSGNINGQTLDLGKYGSFSSQLYLVQIREMKNVNK